MKYLIIPLCLALFATAQAQEGYGTPEERANYQTSQMKEVLPLYRHQVDPVHRLNLKYARIVQQEVIDAGMNHFSAYFYLQKLIKNKEEELFPILSAAQIRAYEELKSSTVRMLVNRFFG